LNKILLVDDDVFQLKIIEKLLTSAGYVCSTAISVEKAESLLRDFIPDLIISDYEMPNINGFVFRERLLENDLLKNVPFLFLTSFNDEQLVQQGLDLQAIDYIPKIIPPSQLLSKINNLMNTVKEQYQKSLSEIKGIAEKLNLRNIPKRAPILNNFEIHYSNQPFQNQPGGDFIDFIQINERYTFVILGDVMGKKWGAWFFSFSFLSYIRSAIRLCVLDDTLSLSEILFKINRVVHADELLADVFSTLSIILIDDEQKLLKYAGAGDLPLLKYEIGNPELISYQSDGLLLGFFANGNYNEQEVYLANGEEAYLISDGMIDFEVDGAKKTDINLLKSRIINLKKHNQSTEEIKDLLFNEQVSQIDDCSFVIIKRKLNENK